MELPDPKPDFKSFEDDLDVYEQALMDNGIVESGLPRKLGLGVPQIATLRMFDAYAEKQLWAAIAKDYLIYSHEDKNDLLLSNGLVEAGLFIPLQQIWRMYLSNIRGWYWRNRESMTDVADPDALKGNAEWLAVKQRSIDAYKTYEKFVKRLDATRELSWISEEIELLNNEQTRQPRLAKPLSEKIDNEKFWSLIDTASADSSGSIELFNSQLVDLLQDYKQTCIKRFQNLLLDNLEALNHWNLWAVAYLSRGGCSEDSFLYFRCWLITQGESLFKTATSDYQALLPHVPKDDDVLNEGLLYVAYEAFEIRSKGREMEVRERKEKTPIGDVWTDDNVERKFPEIVQHYCE